MSCGRSISFYTRKECSEPFYIPLSGKFNVFTYYRLILIVSFYIYIFAPIFASNRSQF